MRNPSACETAIPDGHLDDTWHRSRDAQRPDRYQLRFESSRLKTKKGNPRAVGSHFENSQQLQDADPPELRKPQQKRLLKRRIDGSQARFLAHGTLAEKSFTVPGFSTKQFTGNGEAWPSLSNRRHPVET
jgi:hypothetical protein